MADNIPIAGGYVVGTKEVGGVHFQKTTPVDQTGAAIAPATAEKQDDAAANQVLEIAQLEAANAVLGVVTDSWDGLTDNPTIHGALQFAAERIDALATDVINNSTPATVAQDTTQLRNGGTSLTAKYAVISTSASGDTTLVAAVSGKRIKVVEFALTRAAAVNMKFRSATTDITGLFYNGAAPGFNPLGHFRTAVGELLAINLSAAVGVGGYIVYVEE